MGEPTDDITVTRADLLRKAARLDWLVEAIERERADLRALHDQRATGDNITDLWIAEAALDRLLGVANDG